MNDKKANCLFLLATGLVIIGLIILCWSKWPTSRPEPASTTILQVQNETGFTRETQEKVESTMVLETMPEAPTEPPIPTVESIRTPEFEEFWHEPAVYMAKTLWGEARGCSVAEQQKVAWCILNRVDSYDFPETIIGVIIQPNQFHGYSSDFPCTDELYEVSMDVIAQWQAEKNGGTSNRNLGPEYLYFCANNDGTGNVFRKQW